MERIRCDPARRITLLIEERRREYQEVRCRIAVDHIFERYVSKRIELRDRTRRADLYFGQFIGLVGWIGFRTNQRRRKSMFVGRRSHDKFIALVADGEVHAEYLRAL